MKQKLVTLNDNNTVSYVKIKNLEKEIERTKIVGVIVPLQMESDIRECMILNPKKMILRFSKAEIKMRFALYNTWGMEFSYPENEDYAKNIRGDVHLPEVVFHPSDIIELYSVLHNIDRIRYFNCCTETCASELDYEDINLIDIAYLEINIKDTNLGDIHYKFNIGDFYPHEGAATYCDIVAEKLYAIFDPITRQFKTNERVRIYGNKKWKLTRRINDDGLYGVKLYPSTVVFIDETAYKQFKVIFANHQDLWIDYIAANSPGGISKETSIDILLQSIRYDAVHINITNRIFSPEDLFEVITSFDAFRIIMRLMAFCLGLAERIDDIGVVAVIARANTDWSIACFSDEAWDHENDFIIYDADSTMNLGQKILEVFKFGRYNDFWDGIKGDNYEVY